MQHERQQAMAARARAVRARRHDHAASAALAAAVSTWFLLLTAFVGVNQWLYVLVGACPASVVLRRACRLRSAIYDNDSAPARAQEVAV